MSIHEGLHVKRCGVANRFRDLASKDVKALDCDDKYAWCHINRQAFRRVLQ